MRTAKLLENIVLKPSVHARWLNTLSFLEHIGTRKIVKSQDSEQLNLMVLEHIAEEARHAFFFKKLAHKIDAASCFSYEEKFLLGGGRTEDYFQRLDRKIDETLASQYPDRRRTFFAYLYVTLLVEERAMSVYRLYEEVLQKNKAGLSLRSVLLEEQRHLEQMLELLETHDRHFAENHLFFRSVESELYGELIGVLEKSVQALVGEPALHA